MTDVRKNYLIGFATNDDNSGEVGLMYNEQDQFLIQLDNPHSATNEAIAEQFVVWFCNNVDLHQHYGNHVMLSMSYDKEQMSLLKLQPVMGFYNQLPGFSVEDQAQRMVLIIEFYFEDSMLTWRGRADEGASKLFDLACTKLNSILHEAIKRVEEDSGNGKGKES
ncbi:hypothetical protein GR11A_00143 [Vibrio phage vB_VcorM_GR11A]|nr:hypothetical protein GR11A_00143 [Vibrio phage vB_VcorM_GR11A]